MTKYITRTFNAFNALYMLIDENGAITTKVEFIDEDNEEKAVKIAKKKQAEINGIFKGLTPFSESRRMDISYFLKNSEIFDPKANKEIQAVDGDK